MNRKRRKITIPSKYLLLGLTVFCLALMCATFFTDFLATPLSNVAGGVIIPFQSGVSRIGESLSRRKEEVVNIKDVMEKNELLQNKIDQLVMENNSLQQDKYELNHLRELYDLDKQYENYEKIGARVISKDPGNWFSSFVIDKGTKDGIGVDMNVLAGSGLVGRVIEVGDDWAKVLSVINDNSSVSAMVLSTEDNCIVQGNLETMRSGMITFSKLVAKEGEVKEGDKLVTSYISTKYLPGILIGYVTEINPDANHLTNSGYMTPAVDFSHLQQVLVVTTQKNAIGALQEGQQ
ncbi:MAG: rod shape-determining protein MreC [Lachnospiraceae bacterium]|nr:rod shape-determining protein MreC [Lachnospiraceae bacterium]